MKLFINDIPVEIQRTMDLPDLDQFDVIINTKSKIANNLLIDDVLIQHATYDQIDSILDLMSNKKLKKLDSLTFGVDDEKSVKNFIRKKFKIIKAAGGVVEKDGKILLIYRLKKWDLPKGKLDKGETPKEAAVREVEEECNIKVKLGEKIGSTWHTYMLNGKRILKKTYWYAMECLDDSEMTPQVEEDIEDIRFMEIRESRQALYNSYRTVRHVIHQFYQMKNRVPS
jgi:8-oxo-(d)GTP phosphatase